MALSKFVNSSFLSGLPYSLGGITTIGNELYTNEWSGGGWTNNTIRVYNLTTGDLVRTMTGVNSVGVGTDGNDLYVISLNYTINKIDKTTGVILSTTIATATGSTNPMSFKIDLSTDRLYYAAYQPGLIIIKKFSTDELIASYAFNYAWGVDVNNGYVYISAHSNSTIYRANLSDGETALSFKPYVVTSTSDIVGLSVLDNNLYYSEFGNTCYVVNDNIYLSGNQKTDFQYMETGDYIPCRYTASSNTPGFFSELGTCTSNEIPITGTSTPDGLFNFIKVDKGTLIADRNIQTGLSWDTLNAGGFIDGSINGNKISIDNSSITSSGEYNTYWLASYAFDSSTVNSAWIGTIANGGWIQCKIATSTTVLGYSITNIQGGNNVRYLRSFILKASNTGSFSGEEVNLDTRSGLTFGDSERKVFSISNTTPYLYYRICPTDSGGYEPIISELELFSTVFSIRSLTGGVSYIDANGNSSATNNNLGAYPECNEWDKYIVNSDLDGKITGGDDNAWNWSIFSITKDTSSTSISGSTARICRGINVNLLSFYTSSVSNSSLGFRPVLEFLETDSKATNLFY